MSAYRVSTDSAMPRPIQLHQEQAGTRPVQQQQSLQLSDYIAVLRRRRWLVLGIALICSLAGVAYGFRQVPTYETKAVVLVRPTKVDLGRTSLRPDQLVNLFTEREVIVSEATAATVAEMTGIHGRDFAKDLAIVVVEGTQVVEIQYVDTDPARAQAVTQAFADAYLEQRAVAAEADVARKVADIRARRDAAEQELASVNAEIGRSDPNSPAFATAQSRRDLLISEIQQVQVELANVLALSTDPGEVLTPARLPANPSSPSPYMAVVVALGAGLLLGVPVAFLRDRLDDRIRTINDLEGRLGLPVLAALPRAVSGIGALSKAKLAAALDPAGPTAEGFRRLRAALAGVLQREKPVKLVVTSMGRGEDASFVAAGMAVTLARGGTDVLLVSAETHQPGLHQVLGLPNESGVSEMLMDGLSMDMVVQRLPGVPRLKVITSGNPVGPIEEWVRLDVLDKLMAEPGDASLVIVVAPPLLDSADALGISELADGLVLSSRANAARISSSRRNLHELEVLGINVLGAVLTNTKGRRRRR